ncbi:OLC1v1012462C1 [Oldenlandia corymbosa var. corymbosa]|uniref:Fucosyltransferase n=1 Tax=Oldenlandia corymbosa var. corymbosa TaxID=529605 RepID=A0AAV1DW65_OLDCO|nr:OLC1v1012462C1 [Oldenlandia corymbosa var. corymbosa]
MTMENKRLKSRHHDDPQDDDGMFQPKHAPWWVKDPFKSFIIFAVFFSGSVLFSMLNHRSIDIRIVGGFNPLKADQGENQPREVAAEPEELDNGSSLAPDEADEAEESIPSVEEPHVNDLGGLIAEGFDEKSCLSRYQSPWKNKGQQQHQPSPHLISKLRNYEALHRRCGPHTESFRKASEYINYSIHNNNSNHSSSSDCQYIIWTPKNGLGNQMMSLVSVFLYALLTQKVLLVKPQPHISDLFCEPFPGTSWLIPSSFPPINLTFGKDSPRTYDYYNLKWEKPGSVIPAYAYLYLAHDCNEEDARFFCDEDQTFIQKVPWLIIRSNQYFVPSLFLMPSFQKELSELFPEKETVFHFSGRYLFHPVNPVWSSITSYYKANLAGADEKIGIQVRIFKTDPDLFDKILQQILACVIKENDLLPQIIDETKKPGTDALHKSNRTKAVLITCLDARYSNAIRKMYEEKTTQTGEIIRVFQPSNEMRQKCTDLVHSMKALTDIYLLSLTDKLVTSSISTFGYVAQSLGGLKPWILHRPEEYNASNPGCQRAVSMEPCYLAPPTLDCKTRGTVDKGKIVGYVRHCEDRAKGLKLIDKDDEP